MGILGFSASVKQTSEGNEPLVMLASIQCIMGVAKQIECALITNMASEDGVSKGKLPLNTTKTTNSGSRDVSYNVKITHGSTALEFCDVVRALGRDLQHDPVQIKAVVEALNNKVDNFPEGSPIMSPGSIQP